MPTAHIGSRKDQIAKNVLMPGDPLRAKMIAEKFLDSYEEVNSVRGMLAYTGYYKHKKVTVFASGMGIPSMGIYSYELFKEYDVDNIIRIGTCGAYSSDLKLYDVILVDRSYSKSTYAEVQCGDLNHVLESSYELNQKLEDAALELGYKVHRGNIYCSDVFYNETDDFNDLRDIYGCLGVEMESFGLFHNAKKLGKNASCILTVSDNLVTKEETTSEERQNAFLNMIQIALESIL